MNENQKKVRTPGTATLNFWDMLSLLLRKGVWLLLAGIVGAALTFVVVHFFVTPTYESRVSFYVYNSPDSATQPGRINNTDLQAAESLAMTYCKILTSNSVRIAVLQELGESDLTKKELSKMVDVSVIEDTQMIEVVVKSTDVEQAYEIAKAYATSAPTEIVRITKAGGVEVVDQPEVATEKSSPRTAFDTVIGLIIGVIIAAIFIIIKSISDRTIYLPEDLESVFDVTILGQIPVIGATDKSPAEWKLVKAGVIRLEEEKDDQKTGD